MIVLNGRIAPKRLFGSVRIDYGPFNGQLQAKTVSPSQEEQTVTADSGYVALSLVTVEAATLQEKSVTPSSIEQIVTPDVGVYGLSKVIVAAQGESGLLQDKTVTPSEAQQIVTPDEGYYGLGSVTVEGVTIGSDVMISEVIISESANEFMVTLEDDTSVSGSVSFDTEGNPVGLSDDAGNYVEFSDGYPTLATDIYGNTVSISWG